MNSYNIMFTNIPHFISLTDFILNIKKMCICLHNFSCEFMLFCIWIVLCYCPTADVFCIKITVILLLAIHYPQPCVAVFIVKILSHIATAAQIHLMSGFKEQLKALL